VRRKWDMEADLRNRGEKSLRWNRGWGRRRMVDNVTF